MKGPPTCDTSLLVPALVSWHADHRGSRELVSQVTALPAHVVVECYSVLTRLPAPHRLPPEAVARALGGLSVDLLILPPGAYRALMGELGSGDIRGGAVYDALVAATARHHARHLLTRDRRARSTYDALGVGYTLV